MATKPKPRKTVPAFVEDDEEEPDCPRCPPVGVPAWMATFADMATLLMAFFVLIIAFANFDEVSFKKMTGALREHFGTKILDILPHPQSSTMVQMEFRPATNPPSPADSPDPQQNAGPEAELLEQLTEILAEAMAQGEMTLSNSDGLVSLRLPDGAGVATMAEALSQIVENFAAVAQAEDTAPSEPAPDIALQNQHSQAEMAEVSDMLAHELAADSAPADGPGRDAMTRAAIADARLSVALREIVAQGLVDVQQREEKVIVTVGAGGAFRSGSADLTSEALEIMARIAQTGVGGDAQITVTGHTDSVPLTGGPFTDNWGLAAARASSVVRELGASGLVDPAALSAVSRGEAEPVASNETEEGRAANRRIEIVFEYGRGNEGR
jgi:chemotaxis protein MotB